MTAELILKIVLITLAFLILREFILVQIDRARAQDERDEELQ